MEKINAMKATLEALRSKIERSSGRESRAIEKRKEEENIKAELETTRRGHAEGQRRLEEAQRRVLCLKAAIARLPEIRAAKTRRDNVISFVRRACLMATALVIVYVAVSSRGAASPYASGLDVYRLVH